MKLVILMLYIFTLFVIGSIAGILNSYIHEFNFFNKRKYGILTIDYFEYPELSKIIICPHCHKSSHLKDSHIIIQRYTKKNDIGYIYCPKCGAKIIINPDDYDYFNCSVDFLGNIIQDTFIDINKIVYSVICKPCDITCFFKYSDTIKKDNKRYIQCKNGLCTKLIPISKNNVRIIQIPNPERKKVNGNIITVAFNRKTSN